jgi:diacylglycerol kinase (ATP)
MQFEKNHPFRVARSIVSTIHGMKALWRLEHAFRLEIYASILFAPFLFVLSIPSSLKLLLVLLFMLLWVIEALNSAVEAVVDRISLEIHAQSKLAKDMGSAAVSMTIVMNIIAWVYAFYIHMTA